MMPDDYLANYPGNYSESYAEKSLLILLVEDDDVDQEKIQRLLRKTLLNLRIMESRSAKHALGLLEQYQFDCAIIDYQLKDALGSELIQKILHHRSIPTPTIMISGNSDERIVAEAMRDGLFDYLPKRNIDADLLRKTLQASQVWADIEQQAKEDRLRFNQLAEGLPQLTWTCLPSGRCDFLNRRWCEYTGIPAEAQLGFGWLEQIHPEDRDYLTKAWNQAVESGKEMFVVFRIRRHDGSYRWFDTRAIPQKNERGEIVRWLGSNTDITDVELTRQALANSEQLFQAVFDYAPLGMMLIDLNGKIVQTNPAICQLLGYDEQIFTNGSRQPMPDQLGDFIDADELAAAKFQLEKLRSESIRFVQFEAQFKTRNNHFVPTLTSAAFINKCNDESCYLLQVYDLSERKRYESQLIKMAHFDTLTGLGNRAKLHQEIEFLIKKSHRNAAPFAVLFGDLDHFKEINDGLGHEAGDQLLKIIARRLQKSLRHEDSVCRLGGDEFVILLQDVTKFEAVVAVAEKLIRKIKKPVRLANNRVHVGMTFGIALYPTDGNDAKTLLRNADSALYDAKAKGRGNYQLYRKELTEYVQNRLLLDNDLRKAINNNEFELYYQPVIDLTNNEITSAEALIRWRHPLRGLVPPDEFIPYAQESGLILSIGEWVIQQACKHRMGWEREGFQIGLSINISARQFVQQNLVSIINRELTESKFPAERLTVEITEQMFLENTEINLKQISDLKDMGIKIALDDFGLGYSSLSYIIRFAPHYLKIDRSFVTKIGIAKEHDEMINAIIGLGNIIPMNIVGEGVEQQQQLEFLMSRGCKLGQGYLFSKPLPEHQFREFLQTYNRITPANVAQG
ncbi:MAG TPA: EAL domain-containing protein [Cellvibrio sp.]|nr:EAL domain-containing protein [Cellvibrio sp.]